jgi:predicted MPP superfamily phosphohydrolase
MSIARFALFLVLMLGVLGGLNVYVFRWARKAFALQRRGQAGLKWVLGGSVIGMVVGRVAGRLWPGPVTTSLIAVSSTVALAVIISAVVLLLADGVIRLVGLARRLARASQPQPVNATAPPPVSTRPLSDDAPAAPAVPAGLPRRAFLTQAVAGSAFLIGSSSSLYGALKGRQDYVIERVPLRIPGLARAFDGFNIVQLSDVHIGAYVGEAELNTAVELVRKAKPDLLVLTGDLLDNDPRFAEQLGRFVRRLSPLAREGVVAISGNHDYFAGVEEVASAVVRGGGRILQNDACVVGDGSAGFALLGVDDVWARREGGGPDLQRALAALPKLGGRVAPARDLPRVLLCHNPSYFAEAAGHVALQLSGHTHGGQINLGIRPADYLLPGGWVAGRYDRAGSVLYVNRGFGTVGPPARLGAPPEVTHIVLTA